ncbi:hypothetical protein BX600DRAFT_476978 [Xylariales sp. PMI_506]|nr:hypothetical protein BX600DRAFT_476978 [Xylariales sp. PMI_506]
MINVWRGRSGNGIMIAVACLLVLLLTIHYWSGGVEHLTDDVHSIYDGSDHAESKVSEPTIEEPVIDEPEPPMRLEPQVPTHGLNSCAMMPDTSNILLVFRTGVSESFQRVPTQLLTSLKCLPDFLMWSDMTHSIAGYELMDSLDTVALEATEGNHDFDIYRAQKTCGVDQMLCHKFFEGSLYSAGWNLDKYKFTHTVARSYRMRPNLDWYFIIDADTYVFWPNLVQWLNTMDPYEDHYWGRVNWRDGIPHGIGGSGFLLSQKTMKSFADAFPSQAKKYDMEVKNICCGDVMFAKALKEMTDVAVQDFSPALGYDSPWILRFGPEQWCQPILTLHHINSEEHSAAWEFEQRFYEAQKTIPHELRQPIVFRDLFNELVLPRLLLQKREDWDNVGADVVYLNPDPAKYDKSLINQRKSENLSELEKVAHQSFEHCLRMCEGTSGCLQIKFQNGVCYSSNRVSLGRPVKKTTAEKDKVVSGWAISKIKKWALDNKECAPVTWPKSKLGAVGE